MFHFISNPHGGLISGKSDQIDVVLYLAALYQPVGNDCFLATVCAGCFCCAVQHRRLLIAEVGV